MILKALGERLFSFLILSFFLFIFIRTLPGDPVDLLMGEFAVPLEKERVRHSLGLDQPVLTQAALFYKNMARFDLGTSISRQQPVSTLLKTHFSKTLQLACFAFFLAQTIGLLWAFANIFVQNTIFQKISSATTVVFLSLPSFWLGPLLISLFCLGWPWLPLAETQSFASLFLPAITLSLGFAAMLQKVTTLELQKTLSTPYTRTAVSKGASFLRVLTVHALPNALTPMLSFSMIKLAQLLTGALIVEGIFHWPGLGQLMLDAVFQRDYPTIQGITLLVCFLYSAAGLASDCIQHSLLKRASDVDTSL